jgi:hypothetical protein
MTEVTRVNKSLMILENKEEGRVVVQGARQVCDNPYDYEEEPDQTEVTDKELISQRIQQGKLTEALQH